VTEALIARVGDLVLKFLTHALRLFRTLKAAWTVATSALQTFTDGIHHILIWIQFYFHVSHLVFLLDDGGCLWKKHPVP